MITAENLVSVIIVVAVDRAMLAEEDAPCRHGTTDGAAVVMAAIGIVRQEMMSARKIEMHVPFFVCNFHSVFAPVTWKSSFPVWARYATYG